VALPFQAWSLSRRVVDEALLRVAVAAGADVRRGVKVRGLAPDGAGFRARLEDGTSVLAGAAFLATGKHDLEGFERPAGLQHDLLAFKLHYRLSPAETAVLDRHIEIILFEGGYAGLSLVEDGRANLCLVVRRRRFAEIGRRWDRLLAAMCAESPLLAARLAGAEPCWPKPLALSVIPYGHVKWRSSGVWYLGDQAAVIPSFSGDGMSIALHSARLAAASHLAGASADAFQRRLARDVVGQVLLATALSQGLVRRPTQILLGAATRLFPGLMARVATRTRVPDAALDRAMGQGIGLFEEERGSPGGAQ
jgi:flavin-dependent dehydrogenase